MKKGLVHVYTGDGKGKTTAAVGLAARAAGQGLRAGFCQFLKNGKSGEVKSLEKLGVWVLSPPEECKFLWDMDATERAACAARQRRVLDEAAAMAPRLDLLVLDEAVCLLDAGLVEWRQVESFIKGRPQGLELVLTGRGAPAALAAMADYVTEMRMAAHPFENGLAARRGIEF